MIPDAYIDRFDTPKYRSRNPIQRMLIKRFIGALHDFFIEAQPAERIVEIGAGEGFISGYLSEHFPDKQFTGVDISARDIERLGQKFARVEAHVGSIYELGFLRPPYDVVICAEVLEHLRQPDRALGELSKLGAKRLILSVPHEPFFMISNLLRGKNVTRLGNDIEHINHWNVGSFRRLIERRFDVLRMRTPFPWILALAAPKPWQPSR